MTHKNGLKEIREALLDAQDICHLHKHKHQSMRCLESLLILDSLEKAVPDIDEVYIDAAYKGDHNTRIIFAAKLLNEFIGGGDE